MKHVKLFEDFQVNEAAKETLKEAYDKMKKAFKGKQFDIYTAEENNKLVDSGEWPEENRMEEGSLIICDKPDAEEEGALNGAYDIVEQKGKIYAIWLPYPEKPIIGIDNIIKQVLKQAE